MNKKMKKLIDESKEENGIILDFSRDFKSKEEMQIFFSDYGFISLKKFIPLDVIENIVDDLKFIFEPFATDKANPIDSGIINLDKSDKKLLYDLCVAIRNLSSKKHLTGLFGDITKSITGKSNPVLEISSGLTLGISRDDRLVYNFHQESTFMKDFADNTNAHFPLLRTSNAQNGTMSILPGTHKLGELESQKSQKSKNSVTNQVPKNISEIVGNFPELHCCLELGDVVLFHKDLIHKSNYNSSPLCRLVGGINLTQSMSGNW
jgi:hypothetical protein